MNDLASYKLDGLAVIFDMNKAKGLKRAAQATAATEFCGNPVEKLGLGTPRGDRVERARLDDVESPFTASLENLQDLADDTGALLVA